MESWIVVEGTVSVGATALSAEGVTDLDWAVFLVVFDVICGETIHSLVTLEKIDFCLKTLSS